TAKGIKMGSERSFGLVFATAFGVIALWPLAQGGTPHLWAIVVALVFLTLGCVRPTVLRPLNIAWFQIGLVLSTALTPFVMAVLYVTTFVPTSLLLRLTGRDSLRLRREPDRPTYWIIRDARDLGRGTMKRQF